jgi:hypothetical protein
MSNSARNNTKISQQDPEKGSPHLQQQYQQHPQMYPQQPQYQYHVSSPGQQYYVHTQPGQQVVIVQGQNDDDTMIHIILFAVGFLCMVTWWVSACCVPARTEKSRVWKLVNQVLTGLSLVGFFAIIIVFTIAATTTAAIVTQI